MLFRSNDTATTEIYTGWYTLSLHDALPICPWHGYEYDMKTGECVSDRKLKLRKYKVVEKGDEVYVLT